MGCDIHLYIESKTGLGDFGWESFGGRIDVGRNYELFGLLAGVRGTREALVAPRGLPGDISVRAYKGLQSSDLHCHSWLSRKELRAAIAQLTMDVDGEGVEFASAEWYAILAAMKALKKAGRRVRIVFAFDS